ncbi:TetR/AcrR family transcriptional regulator [Arthrobacter crystallopoietes]|uniref:TetR/AcrR family transcriptional regulator n=1 Tax=Crystallibacter crystallopoietes TaxID=37928 RepID=UPI001ABE012A|nr:TetR/AcrR family transcriptional regulator [Arthrobacter crystallopoietes]QTG82086.1 TetR/AcrR family transcriptional regulator [Arthrobacter crystallopoietes]
MTTTEEEPAAKAARTAHRLNRGSLTRQSIVAAALRILDEDGNPGLTFTRLGKELGASPTAMYRHFPSRDEIVIAVADELIGMSIEGYEPSESWADSLRDLAYRAWRTFAEHPAAAMQTFFRLTRGPNELRAVDAVLEAIHHAGWTGHEAVIQYHVFSNLVLSASGTHAARIAVREESEANGDVEWNQEYQPARPEEYPYVVAAREDLRTINFFEIYRAQVEAVLTQMERKAPREESRPAASDR